MEICASVLLIMFVLSAVLNFLELIAENITPILKYSCGTLVALTAIGMLVPTIDRGTEFLTELGGDTLLALLGLGIIGWHLPKILRLISTIITSILEAIELNAISNQDMSDYERADGGRDKRKIMPQGGFDWKRVTAWTISLLLIMLFASLAWERLAPAFNIAEPAQQASAVSTKRAERQRSTATVIPPSATAIRTYTISTGGELPARVRSCPRTSCEIIDRLRPGRKVRAKREVFGTEVNGSKKWIEIERNGARGYVHISLLE